ncbi:RNA polymerase sigma factor [Streptomyces sp. NPDC058855]|uniref:RNA polymerase sigma factor n=1 Tax=Streptomyces sp. NPDC058855 TaxID=3346651 RepID=UPI00369BE43E
MLRARRRQRRRRKTRAFDRCRNHRPPPRRRQRQRPHDGSRGARPGRRGRCLRPPLRPVQRHRLSLHRLPGGRKGHRGGPDFKSSRFRLEVTTGEMLDANEVERSPEDSVLESLSNAALLEAVRRLNPQQQECVTLRFLQGLSVAETARVMGKNEGAIKTLQYRAVRTLARLLPDDAR